MRHIKKALSYSVAGSLGLTVIASLQGCSDQGPTQPGFENGQGRQDQITANEFLVIEQIGSNPDTYKLLERHPTNGPTRAILRQADGSERFLSEEELKAIAAEEAARVEAGTSRLTQDPSMQAGGLSMGEMLLAAAAGSLVGGMLANRLAGNANFQRNQQRYGGGRPTATISQRAPQQATKRSQPRSGFFGGNNNRSSSNRGFSRFGG